MKKLLGVLLVLVYSCTTTNDGNTTTTTVVPLPPTNLLGTVASTTQINLSWTDNSTNETGFKIERKTGTGTYAVVGTTATDVTTFNDKGLTPSTTYTYRVYSYNAGGNSPTYSNELTSTATSVINLPTLTTTTVSSITITSAVSGGTISNDGGATITARGVCWSTSANPTITLATKTIDGIGTGVFTSAISALVANTIYYARAYATNSAGTGYGTEISFTTLAPVVLSSISIGAQIWSAKNLDVTTYSDGTPIPQVTNPAEWASLTTGAWCYYNNDPANEAIYGKLYNWYAVAGIYDANSLATPSLRKQFAPTGWHVPIGSEWLTLANYLGGFEVAGGSMKESGTVHWISPNTKATNSSGFTALPGGGRDSNGIFSGIGFNGFWWEPSEFQPGGARFQVLYYTSSILFDQGNSNNEQKGYSVRCIKD